MSAMVFFRPDDSFLPWLKAYAAGRPVFDVGCGTGHFLERMWSVDIRAMGIDKYADISIEKMTTRMRTLTADATTCPTLTKFSGLVLFCRPNHTGWVADTIPRLHPDSEALYISKPGNHYVDLPDYKVEELVAPGLSSERVYRVLKPYPEFGEPNYLLAGIERLEAMFDGNLMIEGE